MYMKLNSLNAISPIDGRYHSKTLSYSNFFSEYALIKYRVLVEIEYFIALTKSEITTFKNFPKEIITDIKKMLLKSKTLKKKLIMMLKQ